MHVLNSPRIRRHPIRSSIPFEDRFEYNSKNGLFEPRVFNRALGVNQLIGFGVGGVIGFSPLDLTNLEMWIDFSNEDSITLNGADISQADDLSGNSEHVLQDTAAEQPLYNTTGINGLKTAQFAGSGGAQSLFNTTVLPTASATVVIIGRIDSGSTGSSEMALTLGASAFAAIDVLTSGNWRYFEAQGVGVLNSGISAQNVGIVIVEYLSNEAADLRVNGSETHTAWNPQNDYDNGGAILGNSLAHGGNREWDGEICEFMIYSDIKTSEELGKLDTYAVNKWGVTLE